MSKKRKIVDSPDIVEGYLPRELTCLSFSHTCLSRWGWVIAVGNAMTCSANLQMYKGDVTMTGCISAAEGRTHDYNAKSELKLFSTSLQENEYPLRTHQWM